MSVSPGIPRGRTRGAGAIRPLREPYVIGDLELVSVCRRVLPARRRRDVRRRAAAALGEEGAARRAQPHHARDAAAYRARRADDDHRCRSGRQGERPGSARSTGSIAPAIWITRWPKPGSSAEDIDIVLATHLHFDHAGGFTVRGADGRVRPRFPRAQYVVRRGEWEDATHPNERNRASYLADNLRAAGRGRCASAGRRRPDDHAGRPRAADRRSHDASPDCDDRVGRQGRRYVADLIPTTAHVPGPWIMGYDLYPLDTLAAKKALVQGSRSSATC